MSKDVSIRREKFVHCVSVSNFIMSLIDAVLFGQRISDESQAGNHVQKNQSKQHEVERGNKQKTFNQDEKQQQMNERKKMKHLLITVARRHTVLQ